MSKTAVTRRLAERVEQTRQSLRVTRGGVEVTRADLDSSNDWKTMPGSVVIEGVRVMNRESRNGVIYHDKFIRRAAEIHRDHHAAWEHEDVHGGRPPQSRFGMWRNGRVIEDSSGTAVAAESDLTIYEGDDAEVNRLISKAIRNPKALMFSIEVEEGKWDGYEEDGVTHATDLTEMLDTAAVSFGGTTTSLSETQHKEKTGLTMSERDLSERLLKEAKTEIDRLKESCSCKTTELAELKQENERLKAKNDDLSGKLSDLQATVQENERRSKVAEMAEREGVRLSESDVRRYAKWTDEEVGEQLAKDKKLQEASGRGVESPPSGSSGSSFDVPDDYEFPASI